MSGMGSGWREEARADRLVKAQIDRDQAAAAAQARIAARQAAAAERRADDKARAARKAQARAARAARRSAMAAWLTGHVTDLLFVPVIGVPAVLSWSAMAAYGHQVYGAPGWLLPAFSEGAMWAFAAANTLTRHRHPGRPTWHLQIGTWVFAAEGAALNFAHGVTETAGLHGITIGIVMALVSVAGVVAHQLVTAGPRRSRAERDDARIAGAVSRREHKARHAAVRRAVAEVDQDGGVRLVRVPGAVSRRGVKRQVTVTGRSLAALPQAGPALPWPRPVPVPAGAIGAAPEVPAASPSRGTREVPSAAPVHVPETASPEVPEPTSARRPRQRAASRPAAAGSPAEMADRVKARKVYRDSLKDGGKGLSQRDLGEKFGRSKTWGRDRIAECTDGPHVARAAQ